MREQNQSENFPGHTPYYHFGGKVYMIPCESTTIVYSVEKDENQVPITINAVYEKLLAGDLILSPYTMWEVQFEGGVKGMESFIGQVDLQLEGHGSYVKRSASMPDFKVEEHYKNELQREINV
jgi:hypothetical protein